MSDTMEEEEGTSMEEGSLTKEEEELTSSGGDGDEFPPSTCSIHCY